MHKIYIWITAVLVFLSFSANCQYMEKVPFDASDSTNGYYLAVPPSAGHIRGVLVFFCSFRDPESLLPETKLHNVASGSGLLTVYASLGKKIFPDQEAINRINTILKNVVSKYKADTSQFVLGGFDMAGAIVLRFTEMANEHPAEFALCPKAVFSVAAFVDLSGLYHWSERQIKKNVYPPSVSDARFFLDAMTKEQGTPSEHFEQYKSLSPFSQTEEEVAGNERYLHQTAVRLYYDADINWHLNARGNSLYDTNIPDGTALINRLQLAGNKKAEFISSKQPGIRSNGMRNATAMSIIDETDCIQWIKKVLHILDPNNPLAWEAPYKFITLDGWTMERSYFPAPFAPHVTLTGIEDIRFPKGWGDSKSEEYWSVAYLLWLDGGQKIDIDVMRKNLKLYYDDLVPGGLQRRNIQLPAEKVPPAEVVLKITKTEPGDQETYTGKINMLDYMAQKPMTLNCRVHVRTCGAQNKIPVLLNISPKPFEHPIWKELEKMKENFSCEQ